MAASLLTWGIGEGMFFYFQPIYLQKLGASPIGIGSILGAIGLIMAFTQLPAGYLADRFGRRPLIWVSCKYIECIHRGYPSVWFHRLCHAADEQLYHPRPGTVVRGARFDFWIGCL